MWNITVGAKTKFTLKKGSVFESEAEYIQCGVLSWTGGTTIHKTFEAKAGHNLQAWDPGQMTVKKYYTYT